MNAFFVGYLYQMPAAAQDDGVVALYRDPVIATMDVFQRGPGLLLADSDTAENSTHFLLLLETV